MAEFVCQTVEVLVPLTLCVGDVFLSVCQNFNHSTLILDDFDLFQINENVG